MPSASHVVWTGRRSTELDQIETAHASVGGSGRGRRYATQQINHAYIMLLSSQFQAFCRDLHSESVDYIARAVAPPLMQMVFRAEFILARKLDRGNPTPGNIGADFNRLGVSFWTEVVRLEQRNSRRQQLLEDLNTWRNAIAHQDFDPVRVGRRTVRLVQVCSWRRACDALARAFDLVMRDHINSVVGGFPW